MTQAIAEKGADLKVADAVWVATAMLHKERPREEGFSVAEIVHKVENDRLTEKEHGSIYLHVNQHCVANRQPNQARLRMLFETKGNLRRLYCPTEPSHPGRNGRFCPEPSELPIRLLGLIDWYQDWCRKQHHRSMAEDPLLALAGKGEGQWPQDAVSYVNRLRAE